MAQCGFTLDGIDETTLTATDITTWTCPPELYAGQCTNGRRVRLWGVAVEIAEVKPENIKVYADIQRRHEGNRPCHRAGDGNNNGLQRCDRSRHVRVVGIGDERAAQSEPDASAESAA